MRAAEENLNEQTLLTRNANANQKTAATAVRSFIADVLRQIGSVRFGVVLLVSLLLCCLIGMFIMQQSMNGFREYFQKLTPAQKLVYGSLGFFDIYHSWYFLLLLALTALSIALSSIFRFPKAWHFWRRPQTVVSQSFIKGRDFHAETETQNSPEKESEQIAAQWRGAGFSPKVSREESKVVLFAQRNVWNRFGAHATHLALLVIFAGGFLTSLYSSGGMVEITPGRGSNEIASFEGGIENDQIVRKRLPFTIECTDLKQELIKPEGGLEPMNTVDWLSYIKIIDGSETADGLVHLNEPFDYRGYRFFQSSFEPQGYARQITLSLEPAGGGAAREIIIARNQSVNVEGIGEISYNQFYPHFSIQNQQPVTLSGEYKNPAAQLKVKTPDGKVQPTMAFNPALAKDFYASGTRDEQREKLLIAGSKAILKNFEKVAVSHTLTVQYDPGRETVYVGFALLLAALLGVFFFSHQRVWALIEPAGAGAKIYFGGDTNRYKSAFENRFNLLVAAADRKSEEKQ